MARRRDREDLAGPSPLRGDRGSRPAPAPERARARPFCVPSRGPRDEGRPARRGPEDRGGDDREGAGRRIVGDEPVPRSQAEERDDVRGVRLGGAPARACTGTLPGAEELFDEAGQAVLNRCFPLDLLVRFFDESSLEPVRPRESSQGRPYARDPPRPSGRRAAHGDASSQGAPTLGGPEWRVDAALDVLLQDSEMRPYVVLDPDFSIAWWCSMPVPKTPGLPLLAFLTPDETGRGRERGSPRSRRSVRPRRGSAARLSRSRSAAPTIRAPRSSSPARCARRARAARTRRRRPCRKPRSEHLHARYPKSPWAKRTKYWFEGRGWYPPPPTPSAPPS